MESKQVMSFAWFHPCLIIAGVLQAAGAAMKAQLRNYLINSWPASVVSLLLIAFIFAEPAIQRGRIRKRMRTRKRGKLALASFCGRGWVEGDSSAAAMLEAKATG